MEKIHKFVQEHIKKIILFFLILTLIFIVKIVYIALFPHKLPPLVKEYKQRAVRGSIISSDGYTISRSIKTYSIAIHTKYLDPKKKDFFLTLLSIYTNIPKEEFEKKFYTKDGKKKSGWITLSNNITSKTVIYLKQLKYKLNRFRVFRANGANKNFYYGLTITPIGESREYPLGEAMSPILGYTREKIENNYKTIVGFNGIEKYYNKQLNNKIDGYIKGKRDAVGYIIHDKSVEYKKLKNGYNAILNISLSLQKRLDIVLDKYKRYLGAKEVIAAIMDSKTSKILAITSSNRYDPLNIKADEIENLQPKATTYLYEPGSVLKPITYALALEKKLITPNTVFNTYNGKMYIGGFKIEDDERFKSLTAKEIIIHSSNIGISQIALKLGRKEFRKGILAFGLGPQKSGIDIGTEARGKIYSLSDLRYKTNLTTTAYGYGIHATFAQLLKAYNVFNNDGISRSPRVVNYLQRENDSKKFFIRKDYSVIHPISKETATIVKETLKDVVKFGTGRATYMKNLEIGGKTGTAMIYENGGYQKAYHTSFFGFVNDKSNHKYTIGVLVIRPKYEKHFASQSAVPVFKEIVQTLIEEKLLKPNFTQKELEAIRKKELAKEKLLQEKNLQKNIALKKKLKREREKIIKKRHQEKKTEKKKKIIHHPKIKKVQVTKAIKKEQKKEIKKVTKPKPKPAPKPHPKPVQEKIKVTPAPQLDLF